MRSCSGRLTLVAACLMLLSILLSAQATAGDSLSVQVISLASLQELIRKDSGKVVLVNAWATWCEPCKKEIPDLLKLRTTLADKPFELILLSADDTDLVDSDVKSSLQKLGVDFPTYLIQNQSDEAFINPMNPAWSGALPASFVYDRHGQQRKMFVGRKTYDQFYDAIKELLR